MEFALKHQLSLIQVNVLFKLPTSFDLGSPFVTNLITENLVENNFPPADLGYDVYVQQ